MRCVVCTDELSVRKGPTSLSAPAGEKPKAHLEMTTGQLSARPARPPVMVEHATVHLWFQTVCPLANPGESRGCVIQIGDLVGWSAMVGMVGRRPS